jgi:hypothetical protein
VSSTPADLWAGRVTINILPDDVLLHIFHFIRVIYLDEELHKPLRLSWKWGLLVHVCRRWRSVVFASPNFLDLKLVCGPWTSAERTGIWPPLPIIIRNIVDLSMFRDGAALGHPNRVCEINLHLSWSQLQQLASQMKEQFPALVHLKLSSHVSCDSPPPLPDGFLGGFAPRLQSLELHNIPFPALPKLLLSATDLVELTLWNIPLSGYISPEAIVTGLAVLTNLKSLIITFDFPLVLVNWENRPPPPPTCIPLPALTHFVFEGVSEYLEDLVARIDAPLLESIWITFFRQPIYLAQLAQFVGRTTSYQAHKEAHVDIGRNHVQVVSRPRTRTDERSRSIMFCKWPVLSQPYLAQVFTLPIICVVENLYIFGPPNLSSDRPGGFRDTQWLDFFHAFTALKNLYVYKGYAQGIAAALVGEGVTDVLVPALENLFLEELPSSGPIQESVAQLVSARQLSGHPITVSLWKRDCLGLREVDG